MRHLSIHEVGLMIERSISEEKGKAEGKVEGKAEGETLKTLIVVKNSLAKGFSTALIAELVDLSEAEVLALIRKHKL
jgi:predicted transposase YdaD